MVTLFNQNAAMQILGCLMKNPLLLSEIDKYRFDLSDFDTNKIDKKIFMAIANLHQNGATSLSPIDIDNYLQKNDIHYETFVDNNGIQFLMDMHELANIDNFSYNYNLLKKLSALRQLKQEGYDISKIIDETEMDPMRQQAQQLGLDSMKIEEIFNFFSGKLAQLTNKFVLKANSDSGPMATGARQLVEELKITPEVGFPLQGEIYNTVTRGARIKKFYLLSGAQGSGKTRQMTGHACNLAFPERYDIKNNRWTNTGLPPQKVLFIGTEMDKSEMQTIMLAYISGINEEKILYGTYSAEEEIRMKKALDVLDEYSEYLYFEKISDPNIQQTQAVIRKCKVEKNISCVFFDYIFSNPNLLNEFRDIKIREDVALAMFASALKDLANELDLFIMSGSQLNGNWQEFKGIRNQNLIRGSKALADKIDVGAISLPVTPEELQTLSGFLRMHNLPNPTQVTDVYKARRSRFNHIRIWSNTDLGVARTEDLFMTDVSFNVINVAINKYQSTDDLLLNGFPDLEEETEEEEEDNEIIENVIEVETKGDVDLASLI